MTDLTPETRAKWRAAIDQGTHFAPAHVATLLAALEEAERRAQEADGLARTDEADALWALIWERAGGDLTATLALDDIGDVFEDRANGAAAAGVFEPTPQQEARDFARCKQFGGPQPGPGVQCHRYIDHDGLCDFRPTPEPEPPVEPVPKENPDA